MAQGNIIQGQASGKLGDTVLMVRNGTQVSRVYTTSGARSGEAASFAARLQRVRFGSASNEWQLYRYVSTRMFRKGRSTAQSDYNYFVKRNVDNLPYFTKLQNADGVCCMMPGQFSEGTLGRIELVSTYSTVSSTSRHQTVLIDTINTAETTIQWSAKMSVLKAALQRIYHNARKVTYLFVSTSETQISETGEAFTSQFFQHLPVIVDLYAEATPGENDKSIKQFFSDNVSHAAIKALLLNQEDTFLRDTYSLLVRASTEAEDPIVDSLGVLLFATNDLVSECYTTVLPADSVNTVRGVYSVWGAYRTADALQVACDSYGYQSGVMRDDVATAGSDSIAQVSSYISRISALGSDEVKSYVADADIIGGSFARSVRSIVDSSDD